jgi:DNA-binding CsgD family transcriptional regulator
MTIPRAGGKKSEESGVGSRTNQKSFGIIVTERSEVTFSSSLVQQAEKLHISALTVKTHRKNIMTKLKLHKHSDLVEFALKHNLGPVAE